MSYRFRPGFIPTLAAALLIGLFIWLGLWQLDRAAFKRQLWEGFTDVEQRAPVSITSIHALSKLDRYTPVTVSGRYLAERQILLDNRTRESRPGVHVYTPLLVVDAVVLVNRGWLPLSNRAQLPAASAPRRPLRVSGLASPYPPTGLVLGETQLPEKWPWLTPYLTEAIAEAALKRPVASRVVLLSPQAEHGFMRAWEPDTLPPERHVGYAVQWLALALAVFVVWIVVNVKRYSNSNESKQ